MNGRRKYRRDRRRRQVRQVENEEQFGDNYVYVYREPDEHKIRQSKTRNASVEKILQAKHTDIKAEIP